MIHNPDDRMQKMLKQLSGILRMDVALWYGVFRGDKPRKRRAAPRFKRSPWAPGYGCLDCVAQKPERALRKALVRAKQWQKLQSEYARDPQPS